LTAQDSAGKPALLRVNNVEAAYGPIRALHGITLEVREGSVVALLGANGAGKSTTLRVISGMLHPSSGTVEFRGENVSGRSPSSLVHRGIVHVPEGRQIFGELTVEENLRVGAFTRPWFSNNSSDFEEVYAHFEVLGQRRKQRAGTLSGGEQQMLAIGRAMMARPEVLLLDEPSLGLAPLIVQGIYRIIRTLNKQGGRTILLVEQNASVALDVADYAYVLETGRVAVSGPPAELRGNEDVRRSYLGY
jgi:branched-chain amino acid transport system ATP-binding protein